MCCRLLLRKLWDNLSLLPKIISMGRQGGIAQPLKKRTVGQTNIAIVENKPLARILYHNIDVGMEIPPELYQAVAEILAAVMKTNNRL